MLGDNTQRGQQSMAKYPPVIVIGALRQRDPAFFNGTDDDDVEELSTFEKVSGQNKWNDPSKLQNVPLYLNNVASLWFHNRESTISLTGLLLRSASPTSSNVPQYAISALNNVCADMRRNSESYTSYIDVIDLCKRLNPSMTEQEKLKHIMKDIDEDAFQMLAKDPRTVSELATFCLSFDELRKQCVLARRPETRDDSLTSLTVGGENTTLLLQIKEYVHELARHPVEKPTSPSLVCFTRSHQS